MRVLRTVARFLYDFIVGDDWKIAAAVLFSLGATTVLLIATGLSDAAVVLLGAALLVLAFSVSMVVDVRRT